jgi:hypothetical protein
MQMAWGSILRTVMSSVAGNRPTVQNEGEATPDVVRVARGKTETVRAVRRETVVLVDPFRHQCSQS